MNLYYINYLKIMNKKPSFNLNKSRWSFGGFIYSYRQKAETTKTQLRKNYIKLGC